MSRTGYRSCNDRQTGVIPTKTIYVRIMSSFNCFLQSFGAKCVEVGEKRSHELYLKHETTLEKIYPN